jgi:ariadne-1
MSESRALIAHIQEVCGVPSATVAALLLRTHEWNKERLIERWMDDSDAVLKKAGISPNDLLSTTSSSSSSSKPKRSLAKSKDKGASKDKSASQVDAASDCPICYETLTAANSYALSCQHRYCVTCWKQYLSTALQSARSAIGTRCPFPKCGALVHDEAFRLHLGKPEYERYEMFVRRAFVDTNPKAKWCPAAGCTRAVRVESVMRRSAVQCGGCGLRFCFRCCDADLGDHSPATCADVEAWMRKASSESENLTWLAANTKKCPKCASFIEKNGGCMHMTCTKAGCGFEFCWLCRGSWKEHGSATGGYYKCNKYEKNKDVDKDEQQARQAKTELEHYMFYYHRYESHRNARKVAKQQRTTCAEKEAAILAKFGVRSADTKFMLEAVEQLLRCRRILEFSYVYGYFLSSKQGAERNLFEYLQEDVEKHTNELSEQYEIRDIADYAAFIAWKERVTNLTRVSGKFVDNFCSGVAKGLVAN